VSAHSRDPIASRLESTTTIILFPFSEPPPPLISTLSESALESSPLPLPFLKSSVFCTALLQYLEFGLDPKHVRKQSNLGTLTRFLPMFFQKVLGGKQGSCLYIHTITIHTSSRGHCFVDFLNSPVPLSLSVSSVFLSCGALL
jgi:hypothetical protein